MPQHPTHRPPPLTNAGSFLSFCIRQFEALRLENNNNIDKWGGSVGRYKQESGTHGFVLIYKKHIASYYTAQASYFILMMR